MSKPHSLTGIFCHWHYCIRCGEVALRNEASRKAIAKPCPGKEDKP